MISLFAYEFDLSCDAQCSKWSLPSVLAVLHQRLCSREASINILSVGVPRRETLEPRVEEVAHITVEAQVGNLYGSSVCSTQPMMIHRSLRTSRGSICWKFMKDEGLID